MQSISPLSVALAAGLSVRFVLVTLSLQLSHLPLLLMLLLVGVTVNRCTIHFLARCESQDRLPTGRYACDLSTALRLRIGVLSAAWQSIHPLDVSPL